MPRVTTDEVDEVRNHDGTAGLAGRLKVALAAFGPKDKLLTREQFGDAASYLTERTGQSGLALRRAPPWSFRFQMPTSTWCCARTSPPLYGLAWPLSSCAA